MRNLTPVVLPIMAGLLAVLAGCAPNTSSYFLQTRDIPGWQQHSHQLEALSRWEINGKISIRSEADMYAADLFWHQNHDNLAMRLVAPFSQGVTQFAGDPEQGYQVLTEQGERIDVDSPEVVTSQAFGVVLPFTELQSWVKGLPDKHETVWKLTFDDANRLASFEQSGWQVRLLKYKPVGNLMLPSKVFLKRLTGEFEERNVDVRLIIRRWVL